MSTRRRRNYEEEEDEDDVPLHRKQAFGTGLKRKRVEFVKAQDADESAVTTSAKSSQTSAVGDLYASIVLGTGKSNSPKSSPEPAPPETETAPPPLCPVCSLAIVGSTAQHNASLAHQVSLEHSHPPSALDRSRMGLRALEAQGWDPDARRGLGREGEGVRNPIKVTAKEDTLGIGAVIPDNVKKQVRESQKTLSAKEMRLLAEKERKRGERLQRELYGRVDVERYLRGDGGDTG